VAAPLRPLCDAVDCNIQLSLREALLYFRLAGDEVFLFLPGLPDIYAREWRDIRVWPSLVADYLFCPRLVWVQARLGLRLMTAAAVTAAARGVELHRRYTEWLRRQGVRMAPVRIDAGWVAAEIDAVIEADGYLVPVEVKSAERERASHRLQAAAYGCLMNAAQAILVYPRAVKAVAATRAAWTVLKSIDRALRSARPPPPGRDCGRCAYREACSLVTPAAEEILSGAERRAMPWGEVGVD